MTTIGAITGRAPASNGQSSRQLAQIQQVTLNTKLLLETNPWMAQTPDALMSLATSGADPVQLMDQNAALGGLQNMDKVADTLGGMSDVAQRATYGQFTESQQRSLANLGYDPPADEDDDGFFNTVMGGLADVAAPIAGALVKPIAAVAGPTLSKAFSVLTWIGDVPAHFYRAIRQMDSWQQWVALGAAAAGIGLAAFTGGASLGITAGAIGSLQAIGTLGLAGLGAATASTALTAVTNPTEWWDIMSNKNGERIFTGQSKKKALELLGGAPQLDALARDFAANIDLYELAEEFAGTRDAMAPNVLVESIERVALTMVDPGTAEYDQLYAGLAKLVEQPEFREAVDTLHGGKISFGRDAARAFGIQPGETGYNLISGGLDAAWLVALDPMMFAGSIGKLVRVTRRGVDGAAASLGEEGISRIADIVAGDEGVKAVFDQVAAAMEVDNFAALPKNWRGMHAGMKDWAVAELAEGRPVTWTTDKVLEYVQSADGVGRIMRGEGSIRGVESVILSKNTPSAGFGGFVDALRSFRDGVTDQTLYDHMLTTAKNMGVESDVNAMIPSDFWNQAVDMRWAHRTTERTAYQAGMKVGEVMVRVPGGTSVVDFMSSITTMNPAGYIRLVGEGSETDIPRFVEAFGRHMNVPSFARDEWLNKIMQHGEISQRRALVASFMDSTLTASGMRSTDKLARLTDDFLSKYHQAYAYGGLDVGKIGINSNIEQIMGVYPVLDSAVDLVVPKIREMALMIRNGHILKNIARVSDHDFAEQALSRFWKPGVLLRIGFIPRAAGEEMLAFVIRVGEGSMVQEVAGKSIAREQLYTEAVAKQAANLPLSPADELHLTWGHPKYFDRLIRMSESSGWMPVPTQTIDNWAQWFNNAATKGLGHATRLDGPPSWLDTIAYGKAHSWRRMIANGVDPYMIEAGRTWTTKHADAIMRATSSMGSSRMEESNKVSRNAAHVMVPDPKNPGERIATPAVLNGQREFVDQGHDLYVAGAYHQAVRWTGDDIIRDIIPKHLAQWVPEEFALLGRPQVAKGVELAREVKSYPAKMILNDLLVPDVADMRQTVVVLRNRGEDAIADALHAALNQNDPTLEAITSNIDDQIQALEYELWKATDVRLTAEEASHADVVQLEADIEKLTTAAKELRRTAPLLEGMDAVSDSERNFMASVVARDQATRGRQYADDDLRAMYRNEPDSVMMFNRPKNVWYRAMTDSSAYRINSDGSLTLIPHSVGHLQGDGISFSLDPYQSAGFARGPRIEGQPTMTGSMVEIDGDVVLAKYNMTQDELLESTQHIQHIDPDRLDRPVLLGHNGVEAAEIGVRTDIEMTIPAGKWRIQNTEDMEALVAASAESTSPYASDFTNGIISRFPGGRSLEDFIPAFKTKLAELDDMPPELKTELVAYLNENRAAWEAYYADPFADGVSAPHALLDADDFNPSTDPLENWLANFFGDQDTVDMFNVMRQFSGSNEPTAIDDLFRRQLGLDPVYASDPTRAKNSFGNAEGLSQPELLLAADTTRRGTGDWHEQVVSNWSLYSSRDEMMEGMANDIAATLMRPENQEWVRNSGFANMLPDGTPVVKPMQEGLARVYVPMVPANVDDIIERIAKSASSGASPDDVIAAEAHRLINMVGQSKLTDPVLSGMTLDDQIKIIGQALEQIRDRAAFYRQPVTQTLQNVAYSDPRIARWVSSVLTAQTPGNNVAMAQVGFVDVPRGAMNSAGQIVHNVRLNGDFGEAGKRFVLGNEYVPGVHIANADHVMRASDGSLQMGASYEKAVQEYARQIVKTWETSQTRGTRVIIKPKASRSNPERTLVGRRSGTKYEEIGVGDQVVAEEDLFRLDEAGNPVEPIKWGDRAYFDHEAMQGSDEFMWNILGPALRDVAERNAGLARQVPRHSARKVKEMEIIPGGELPDADEIVYMTRSRISDIHKEGENVLPNITITEQYKLLPNTVWDRIVRHGFDTVIGPTIDALARKPMSFHYYAAAYKSNMQRYDWMLDNQLFDEMVPAQFNEVIAAMKGAGEISPEQIADAQLVARNMFDVNLDSATPDQVRQWLIGVGKDTAEFRREMKVTARAARAKASNEVLAGAPKLTSGEAADIVASTIDQSPAFAVSQAADRLSELSTDAMAITLRTGDLKGRSAAHQLVGAYNDRVPAEVWEQGHDAVQTFLKDFHPELPHNFTPEQWRVLKGARDNMQHTIDTIEETAALRAMGNVTPFLDSHEQRTVFAEFGRNLLPFWYAEENFLKRWSKTLALGGAFGLPTLRKAQLSYMGIKSSGVVRTDENGKDWFVYPGSGLLMEAIAKIPGFGETVPAGIIFQASTDSMLPGVSPNLGNASPSPFVAVTTDLALRLFPDSTPLRRAIVGDLAMNKSAIEQFIPTTVTRAWEAAFGNEESSARYASAMLSAIAFSEASDQGLPDNASAAQMDEYLDKIRNHARIIMLAQTLTGYVVPGSPVAMASGAEMGSVEWLTGVGIDDPRQITSGMYREYVQNLGVDEGTQAFLAAFPTADLEDITNPLAFTTSMSSSPSGAALPATKVGLKWYTDNKSWVDSQPEAGAWFLPTEDAEGKSFDYYSYSQQLANGLRKQRTPAEFLTAIKYRQGADLYFEAVEDYEDKAISLGSDQANKRILDENFEQWKATYLAAHPIFSEEISSGDGRQRRARTIEQMRFAVNDPSAPQTATLAPIKEMVEAFDAYKGMYRILNENRDEASRAKIRALKANFAGWVDSWKIRNPSLERMWSSVYKPEAGLD